MKFKVLAVLACLVAVPAGAATITRSFHAVASFIDGSYTQIALDFGVSYDPAENDPTERPLLYFTSSIADPAFAGTVRFNNFYDALTIGKPAGGVEGYDFGTSDFTLAFFVDPANGGAYLGYTEAAQEDFFSYDVQVAEVAPPAVPEPASWAMLVAGFGILGAGLRIRRRTAVFR